MNKNSNGRINLLDAPNPMILFDRTPVSASDYREALEGTLESSMLSKVFFSAKNQQIVQNAIRAGVYKMSGNKYAIAPQPFDQIKIIMRSVFLERARHLPDDITAQVEELNALVVRYAVPKLFGEAQGYVQYLKDASTLVVPLSTPINTVSYDKTLELKPFF
jgi:hypothetical protein